MSKWDWLVLALTGLTLLLGVASVLWVMVMG
jgi:hypothetical protein